MGVVASYIAIQQDERERARLTVFVSYKVNLFMTIRCGRSPSGRSPRMGGDDFSLLPRILPGV